MNPLLGWLSWRRDNFSAPTYAALNHTLRQLGRFSSNETIPYAVETLNLVERVTFYDEDEWTVHVSKGVSDQSKKDQDANSDSPRFNDPIAKFSLAICQSQAPIIAQSSRITHP